MPLTAGGRFVMGAALILSKLLTALLCALAAAVVIQRKVKEENEVSEKTNLYSSYVATKWG